MLKDRRYSGHAAHPRSHDLLPSVFSTGAGSPPTVTPSSTASPSPAQAPTTPAIAVTPTPTITAAITSTPLAGETVIFVDDFGRPDSQDIGNGWSEYEPSGVAANASGQLHLTSGSKSRDGVKVFRALPQQNDLRISGTLTIEKNYSRVWVLVRADGAMSAKWAGV